jgi:hypothetical protein
MVGERGIRRHKPNGRVKESQDSGLSVLVCDRDCGLAMTESRYLFWAKVLREYQGGGKSLDIHALEAIPGALRVAEANFGWNLAVGFLLFSLMVAPAWGTYDVALIYIPSLGTSSGPQTPPGAALFFVVLLFAGVIVVMACGSSRTFGRFLLAGAFVYSRKVHALAVVQVEPMRTPRSWRLRCRAEGRDLTVVVSVRRDGLRAALQLAGQPVDLLP